MNTTCGFLASWRGWVATFAVATLGAYVLWAHTGHVVSALPYLLFLACPLMHIFGHGHGDHGSRGGNAKTEERTDQPRHLDHPRRAF
jgi:hypothetical protein